MMITIYTNLHQSNSFPLAPFVLCLQSSLKKGAVSSRQHRQHLPLYGPVDALYLQKNFNTSAFCRQYWIIDVWKPQVTMAIYVCRERQCGKTQLHENASRYSNASMFSFLFPSDVNEELTAPSFVSSELNDHSFYYRNNSRDKIAHFIKLNPIHTHLFSLCHILRHHTWRPVNILQTSFQPRSSSFSNSTCVRYLQKWPYSTIYF